MGVTRVAAIDCGTNSIRLLIADRSPDRRSLTHVVRRLEMVRLGQGVDATGRFDPVALARTLAATETYAQLCREHGVEAIRFVATSATRDASNRDEFLDGVRERLGVPAEVISGAEEASLSFAGVISGIGPRAEAPYLVVDIGGGSSELVLGRTSPTASISLDIGSVRLTERHLRDDPPTPAQVEAAAAAIRTLLDDAAARVPLGQVATLVGVAGSVTTVTAHALGLDTYRPERIDGAMLPVDQALAACQDLVAMDRAARVALPYLHPGRVDVIAAGALIWFEIISRVVAEVAAAGGSLTHVRTSEHDILDGIALTVGPPETPDTATPDRR
ncbi:Ppx/GppA phosphatase family protein [Occultella aeris]|uniref:Guanosine-5'-triphosphate,3'-diphosphate pyrophosphatase n=1 Tax=Occultella aeris TaxID=2761496 RepID=A0A7M4DJ27_9MICO|nr:Guanosine-5'-triphosphate,3'-diphosphate pyrophosphatase [Occultella aeris]